MALQVRLENKSYNSRKYIICWENGRPPIQEFYWHYHSKVKTDSVLKIKKEPKSGLKLKTCQKYYKNIRKYAKSG
jgi:hypothetical protein